MSTILPRLATIAGMLVICLGATGSNSCTFFGKSSGSGGSNGSLSFVTQLRLQNPGGEITNSFQRGERVEMVLTVRNRLDRTVQVDFTTGRTSDFVVVRENTSEVIWKWSDGQTFPQTATTLSFTAGETKTFNVSWTQVNTSGTQVRVGSYEARGVLFFTGFDSDPLQSNQMGSSPERFTIN
jgi:hypothetical protein